MKRRLLHAALLLGICISTGLTAAAQSPGGNVEKFALVIGIKGYPNFPQNEKLNYADSDATAFRNFILSPAGGNFRAENVKLLLNGEATRKGIYEQIEWLGNVTEPYPNAVVYVFFSGHGVSNNAGQGFLMPYEAHKDSPLSTGGIRADQFLQDLEANVNARHLILFIDACYAGAVVNPNGTAKGGPNVSAEFIRAWNQSFNSAQAIHMGLFSASSNQLSHEDHEFKRGLFAHFLLAGLKGKADRSPKDGRVDAGELHRYVLDEVDKASRDRFNARQTPIVSPTFDPNLTLAITPSMKALNPHLLHVKFFETNGNALATLILPRLYRQRFDKDKTRYVNWELGVKVPAPGTEVKVNIEAVWHKPDGTIFKQSAARRVTDDATKVNFTGPGYGNKVRGSFSPGRYTVNFFLDGDKFASGSFEVIASSSEATTTAARPRLKLDFSAPTFWSLNPTVNFVKFFERGKGPTPPAAQRKYTRVFLLGQARYVCWELDVAAAPGEEFDFNIDTVWYGPDGAVIGKESIPTHIKKDWKGVNRTCSGLEYAGKWEAGLHRVDFFVEQKKLASAAFFLVPVEYK